MKNKNLILMDLVPGTSTNADGLPLFIELSKWIDKDFTIKLSLTNLTPLSTSFLNSSFGELADKYGYELIKKHLIITDYRKSDAIKIRDYLFEVTSNK